jgi:hypothetical protein
MELYCNIIHHTYRQRLSIPFFQEEAVHKFRQYEQRQKKSRKTSQVGSCIQVQEVRRESFFLFLQSFCLTHETLKILSVIAVEKNETWKCLVILKLNVILP